MTTQASQLDAAALGRVLDVVRRLGAPIDLDRMLGEVIDAALAVLHADRGTVFLYDASTDELYAKVATGAPQIRFPAGLGLAGECARSRNVVNVPNCYADPRFNPEIDRRTGYRTRCLLTVPLIGFDDSLVGVMQVLNKEGGPFDDHDQRIATALAAQCAVALQRAKLMEEQLVKQKLERDIALARDIQQRVFPAVMPRIAGYDLAGFSRPAEQTGGDIYDAVALGDGRTLVLLGDATGHGIGPALSVTQMRSMVRMATRLGAGLDDIFRHVNDQLAADLADNRFVTAFLGVLDPAEHRLIFHSGGQAPLLHMTGDTGECRSLDATTVPLGIMADLPMDSPPGLAMGPGDLMALISDGVFEYQNPVGEQMGSARVVQVLREHRGGTAQQIVDAIDTAVAKFAHGAPQADDITVVIIKRNS